MPAPPVIATPRLLLRTYREQDLDALHRLWTDPLVRKFLWDDVIITRERAEEALHDAISSTGIGQWVVLLPHQSEPIGFCGFRPGDDPPDIELLFGIAPEHWGRGLATEAARAALAHGFEILGLQRVTAAADAPNAASLRVIEKLGMSFAKRVHESGREILCFSLEREAYLKRPRN